MNDEQLRCGNKNERRHKKWRHEEMQVVEAKALAAGNDAGTEAAAAEGTKERAGNL